MWLLPTRNRPKAVEALIASMEQAGEVPETAVMVDGPMYQIAWPKNWHVYESYGHMEMQRAMNYLLREHPNEKHYGILTDQSRPITPQWASKLEAAAGPWDMAMCNTTRPRTNPRTGLRRVTTICVGGDLVRAIGWIWLDKVCHLYGDDAWEDIGYALDCIKFVPDVVVQALLKREGEVPIDANHNRMWKGKSYMATDAAAFDAWKRDEFPSLIERLKAARK
jgi:hypothetical protein